MHKYSRLPSADRLAVILSLLPVALMLSGIKACREDYEFATQTKLQSSSQSDSDSSDESDDAVTQTSTSGSSVSAESSEAESEESSAESKSNSRSSSASTKASTAAAGLLPLLAELSEEPSLPKIETDKTAEVKARVSENWLGNLYDKGEEEGIDSDGDGYSDALEKRLGTLTTDARSVPPPPRSRLVQRLGRVDQDFDGLLDTEEREIGTSLQLSDSDGDGVSDGAEVLSGSSPLDGTQRPQHDSDSDGLSDDYESSIGTNPHASDSDGDGLRDDKELSVGSNPLRNDSDGDGVFDGKEIELGADPLKVDY